MSTDTATDKAPRLQIDDTLGRRVVVIDKPVFRIGRKSESDLRPASVDVSREHAAKKKMTATRMTPSRIGDFSRTLSVVAESSRRVRRGMRERN